MKHSTCIYFILLLVTCITSPKIQAQVISDSSRLNPPSRVLKLNLAAIVFKNLSLQYEQKINERNSFALAIRYRPKSNIPFQKAVAEAFVDTLINVNLFKVGNIGIIPEYRFYLGKKGVFHGFYLGVFLSYNHYSSDVPVNYYDYINNVIIEKTATFSGSVNTYTAGVQAGAHFDLGKNFFLDWWIAGPNYGLGKGNFSFAGALNDIEQISLKYELEKIKQTIPVINIEVPRGSPNASGATFKVDGPWAGIRAMGINIGYRF